MTMRLEDFEAAFHATLECGCKISIFRTEFLAGLKKISDENVFFENVHLSLFKKDATLFFNQVWSSFLTYHKKTFELHFAGIGLTLLEKKNNWSLKERINFRNKYHKPKLRELLMSDYITLKFCPICGNFQIYNRFPLADKKCRQCGGIPRTSRDKQFFSNLALVRGTAPVEPPQGYQTINDWAKSTGISKRKAQYFILNGRIPVVYKGKYLYIKMNEPLPPKIHRKNNESELIKNLKKSVRSSAKKQPFRPLYFNPYQLSRLILKGEL